MVFTFVNYHRTIFQVSNTDFPPAALRGAPGPHQRLVIGIVDLLRWVLKTSCFLVTNEVPSGHRLVRLPQIIFSGVWHQIFCPLFLKWCSSLENLFSKRQTMILETRTNFTEVIFQPRMQVFPTVIFGPASASHLFYVKHDHRPPPRWGLSGILLGLTFDLLLKGTSLLYMISASLLQWYMLNMETQWQWGPCSRVSEPTVLDPVHFD